MIRSILVTAALAGLALFAGCAALLSNPVPPQPSLTGIQAENAAWRDQIHRSRHGGLPVFEPLANAEDALNAAEKQSRVNDFDQRSLSQARQALRQARSDWQAIAGNKKRRDDALAGIADKAHRAERLAEIAQYTAKREIGLKKLNDLRAQQSRSRQRSPGIASTGRRGNLIGRRVVPDMLGSLRFQSGTARLTQGSHPVIMRLAKLMAAHPKRGLAVFGFTDNSEPPAGQLKAFVSANPKLKKQNLSHDQRVEAYHQGLSDARARDVAQLLVQAGVDAHRIGARGMGATHPVASNDTASSRRKNERAEVVIVPLNNDQGG